MSQQIIALSSFFVGMVLVVIGAVGLIAIKPDAPKSRFLRLTGKQKLDFCSNITFLGVVMFIIGAISLLAGASA